MRTQTSDRQARELAEIDERARGAWERYTRGLRDLRGRDYEEAEDRSWERLQRELEQLEDERTLVLDA